MATPYRLSRRLAAWVIVAAVTAGCGSSNSGPQPNEPSPPSQSPPTGSTTIQGNERLGWDQTESDPARLSRYQFRLYVDGSPNILADVRCSTSPSVNGIPCSARLPALSPGGHVFELAAILDGRESARSASISVAVRAGLEEQATVGTSVGTTPPDTARCNEGACVVHDRLSILASPLSELAAGPDGLLFAVAADRESVVRLGPDGGLWTALQSSRARTIAAIALDSQFPQSRAIYVAWQEGTGVDRRLAVSRFSYADGSLGQEATVVAPIPAPMLGDARLAVADGLVYLAIPAESTAGRAEPYWGNILRFTPDGGTPWQTGQVSPVLAVGVPVPVSLGLGPFGSELWLAGRSPAHLQSVSLGKPAIGRPVVRRVGNNGQAVTALTVLGDGLTVLFATSDGRLWFAPYDRPDAATQTPLFEGTVLHLSTDPTSPQSAYALVESPAGTQAVYRLRVNYQLR